MRAFLAIALSQDATGALAQLQEALAASRADVKWVKPAHLHVTLKFLDEISDEQRQAVEALLGRVGGVHAPFTLGLEHAGAFPSVEAPRVVWVGLGEGRANVVQIAEAIEVGGRDLGLRREERPFAAHVTIGRARSSNNRRALTARLQTVRWQSPAPWRVTSLTLYQSVLSPSGPQYSVLAEVPLSGGDVGGDSSLRETSP